MEDLGIIDEFVATFSSYIESGFGLLGGEVQYLTAILIGIDITLAGLYWAMGSDSSVIGKFLKKVMYVGVFALIITNFSVLSTIIFNSFGGLGLEATATSLSVDDLLRPGFIANTGYEAAHPLLDEISRLSGPVKFFTNIVLIAVLALAWVITLFAFFFLAIQLFVTIIEFKLTTLAGFILIPFALWNKTSFLAEKVLGNVVASGIKLMVLAIIIGIGSTIFGDITAAFGAPLDPSLPNPPPAAPIRLEDATAVILASMALLALGIFGPGIATGLVSGAPQLGAGAAVGTMAAIGGGAVAGGAVAGAAAGTAAKASGGAVKAGASLVGGARSSFSLGKVSSGAGGIKGAVAGAVGMAQAAGGAIAKAGVEGVKKATSSVTGAHQSGYRGAVNAMSKKGLKPRPKEEPAGSEPNWAKKVHRKQQTRNAGRTASNAIRNSDSHGGAMAVSLRQED